jgi:signal peptidase I
MLYQPSRFSKPRLEWRKKVREELLNTVIPTLLFVLVMNLLFPRYGVQGHSMEPNIRESDRLFAINANLDTRPLQRGEMVIFPSLHDGKTVVKRVIGLPGETVEIRGGAVYIDGELLPESYITEPMRYTGRWEIAAGQYFVLGDNRNHSLDSSRYGPVPAESISGVVKFRFFPLNQLNIFSLPDYSR